jgi:multicomponent Na+:H+ antiporter subunit D
VTSALISLGILSALVGAVGCALQADIKRQVAFITVSNGGAVSPPNSKPRRPAVVTTPT